MAFVIGTLIGIFKMNKSKNSDQFEFPKPEEYWFQHAMPSIGMAAICIFVILRKQSLRTFLIQEIRETLSKFFNIEVI